MADLTLYSISQELAYVADLMDRDVLSPEEEKELTDILTQKLQKSGEEIIQFYKSNQAYTENLKNEIKDLQDRKKKAENRETMIRERLTENMKKIGLPRLDTTIGSIVIPNRVDLSVEVVDLDKVPEQYIKVKTEKTVDKTAIKKWFKDTGEIIEGTKIVENAGKAQFKQAVITIQDSDIKQFTNLITSIAKKYTSDEDMQNDLIQEGYLGLLQAEKNYDPTKATKFSTYAYSYINYNMLHYYQNMTNDGTISLDTNIEGKEDVLKSVIESEQLERALEECSQESRDIILMKLDGLTVREIAEKKGYSKSKVSYILSKEKDKLYKFLRNNK